MKVSFSKLNTVQFCAKKYDYQYRQYLKEPESEAAKFGTSLHKALELHARWCQQTGATPEPSKVVEVFAGQYGDTACNMEFEMFLQAAKDYLNYTVHTAHATELFFAVALGRHKLSGKIDLIYTPKDAQQPRVRDYKVVGNQRSFDKLTRPDPLQLGLYVEGARAAGFIVGRLDYLVFRRDTGEVVLIEHDVPADIDGVLTGTAHKADTLEGMTEFPRAFLPGRCNWCGFQKLCTEQWLAEGTPAAKKTIL